MEVLDVAQRQTFKPKRDIATGQVFDDAIEAPPTVRVVARLAHGRQPFCVHEVVELRAWSIEEREFGEILCSCGIGVEPVGEPDPVDHAALYQSALIHPGIEFE